MKTKTLLLLMTLFLASSMFSPSCKKFEQPRFNRHEFLPQLSNQYDWCWEGIKKKRSEKPPIPRDTVTLCEYGNFRNAYVTNVLDQVDILYDLVRKRYDEGEPLLVKEKKWTPEKVFDKYIKPGVTPLLFAFYPEFFEELRKKVKSFVCDAVKGNVALTDSVRRKEIRDLFETPIPGNYDGKTWGAGFKEKFDKLYGEDDRPHKIRDGLFNLGWLDGNNQNYV